MPELPEVLPSAEEVFEQMNFDDKWKDAEMQSVCHYLRGAKELVIPESFRKILPRTLWSSLKVVPLKPKVLGACYGLMLEKMTTK